MQVYSGVIYVELHDEQNPYTVAQSICPLQFNGEYDDSSNATSLAKERVIAQPLTVAFISAHRKSQPLTNVFQSVKWSTVAVKTVNL